MSGCRTYQPTPAEELMSSWGGSGPEQECTMDRQNLEGNAAVVDELNLTGPETGRPPVLHRSAGSPELPAPTSNPW
jgi:hypothetical protein